ncbi:simple sugar transport system permease protein [Paenibacillus sp. UNCCL117]|uniref:ABC transporter permease n=1 Tax=unclassified Paenibacillus TaxID=185978 RepID=UPI0008882E08|nr:MULTISPECIES: ABC transporter permease [unclassified Paenibacillus]SDD62012.1 simple sugar transport system permease protein [Paenibacillus sp. cl123]SFW67594.1 simple sugar transport system permease protein [Paenibacillus sp. UNCCL117]
MKDKLLDYSYKYGALAVIAIVIAVFSMVNENFLSYDNMADILRSISIVTFVAIGVTFSQIVDGFDLSVGSTVSLTTVVVATMMVWYQLPLVVVLTVPLIIGIGIGLLNALLIVKVRIPDLLATLAVMYIIGGVHKTYTKGFSIYNNMQMTDGTKAPGKFDPSYLWIGQGKLLGVPVPVLIMIIAVILVHIFLTYTRWGRQMYVTGGNQEAARLSGISVNRVRTVAYMLSGLFAAIGGILFAARVGSGQIDAGAPLLMESVAAVFVGYSVLGAGKPNVIGTFFGAVLIGVLLNGLTMLNLPYYAFDIVKGTVLVLALAITFIHLNRRRT